MWGKRKVREVRKRERQGGQVVGTKTGFPKEYITKTLGDGRKKISYPILGHPIVSYRILS